MTLNNKQTNEFKDLKTNPILKRQLIMQHYQNPVNFRKIDNLQPFQIISNHCVDNANLYLKFKNQTITEVGFDGQGCAIFISSIDLLLNLIKNKKINQVKIILENYYNLLYQLKSFDESIIESLIVFNHLKNQANRLHCAELVYDGVLKLINQNQI